ncbi:MAG: ribbon-helix-helix domain-containing protein [Chloroflexota bacterium]
MATDLFPADTLKITVTLPRGLLTRLDEYIPARRRSQFIAQAIEERLALEEQMAALEESAGAWSDANHPEMLTEKDIDDWLIKLRQSWNRPEISQRG